MEAPAPCFKRYGYGSITVTNACTLYGDVSQSSDDGTLYEGQIFGSKEEVVDVVKKISIRSKQQYFLYNSTKYLLHFKCKRQTECSRTLHGTKRRRHELCKFRSTRVPTLV